MSYFWGLPPGPLMGIFGSPSRFSCRHGRVLIFFPAQFLLLTTLRKKPSENIVGQGENAVNQCFLLFQQRFLPFKKKIYKLSVTFILSSANALDLDMLCSYFNMTRTFIYGNITYGPGYFN